jgi:hypothetical protein
LFPTTETAILLPVEFNFVTLMTEPAITLESVAKHNLTPEEYAHVRQILGREPSRWRSGRRVFECVPAKLQRGVAAKAV